MEIYQKAKETVSEFLNKNCDKKANFYLESNSNIFKNEIELGERIPLSEISFWINPDNGWMTFDRNKQEFIRILSKREYAFSYIVKENLLYNSILELYIFDEDSYIRLKIKCWRLIK